MDWPVAGSYAATFFLTLGSFAATSGGQERPSASATPPVQTKSAPASAAGPATPWAIARIETLPGNSWGKTVRLGRDLIVATYAHLGPEVADAAKRFTGNNLSCQSCHLEAGAKQHGLPFVGVFGDFPQYRAREGEVGTIEDRINGCMMRSMNGRPLPLASPEMKAMVAYIKFVSTGTIVGAATKGRGSGKIAELDRPAGPARGQSLFAESCAACHGADGLGKRHGVVGDAKGYEFPPLWGPDSYNNGAGMARLISAANFIHANMPLGATLDEPVLPPEDSWDIAAYIDSRDRPQKSDLDRDFPVRTEKPADAAYGPYIDGLSPEQHKFGPFQPIRDKLKAMK